MNNLIDLIARYKGNPNFFHIRYEDLVESKFESVVSLEKFLEIDLNPEGYKDVRLDGVMGDPKRNSEFAVSCDTEYSWLPFITNSFRKGLILSFISDIGREKFEVLGYNYDETVSRIRNKKVIKQKKLISDTFYFIAGVIYNRFQPRVVVDAVSRLAGSSKSYIYR